MGDLGQPWSSSESGSSFVNRDLFVSSLPPRTALTFTGMGNALQTVKGYADTQYCCYCLILHDLISPPPLLTATMLNSLKK